MIKKLQINNFDELKNLSIKTIKQYAYKKFKIKKEFDGYLLYLPPYYNNTLFIVSNNKVIYTDEEIHYTLDPFNFYKSKYCNYNKLQIVQRMIERANEQIFTDKEITNQKIKSYTDYRNKVDFINNIAPHKFNYITMFHIGQRTPQEERKIKKMYPCWSIAFAYFEKQEQVDYITGLYQNLQEKYKKDFLTKKKNREQTIIYELLNHEAYYTYDISSTFESLESDGFTTEEIRKVFYKNKKKYAH